MIYIFALIVIAVIVLTLSYLITLIDDPSGDGKIGLAMLTWIVGGAAAIFTVCFGICSAIIGSWVPGIFLALFIIYLINKKVTSSK